MIDNLIDNLVRRWSRELDCYDISLRYGCKPYFKGKVSSEDEFYVLRGTLELALLGSWIDVEDELMYDSIESPFIQELRTESPFLVGKEDYFKNLAMTYINRTLLPQGFDVKKLLLRYDVEDILQDTSASYIEYVRRREQHSEFEGFGDSLQSCAHALAVYTLRLKNKVRDACSSVFGKEVLHYDALAPQDCEQWEARESDSKELAIVALEMLTDYYLTDSQNAVLQKKLDGVPLANNERQTLHRIKRKFADDAFMRGVFDIEN